MAKKYQRKIQRGIVMPVQQFINREKSAGVVLGISIVVAMILANSPWSEDYFHLFENKVGFFFNGEPYLYYSLHHWINDGLMSMFFFVVGLELKREFIGGELSDPRHTILPIGAAVAGMLVPALIYTLLNAGTGAAGGWGIPMATDIAFSLAIIYLLGDRVPLAAKVFLTTLAIVDDLGAVVVIAFTTISAPEGSTTAVMAAVALAIGAGTLVGGHRIIRTLGRNLTDLSVAQGLAAETSSATTMSLSLFGLDAPVSTSHSLASSVVGAGVGRGLRTVRWRVAGQILLVWLVTPLATALLGAALIGVLQELPTG